MDNIADQVRKIGWYTLLHNKLDYRQVCVHEGISWRYCITGTPHGPRFNIKMSSYQYRKSHCGDKTVVRSSYLHNGIPYTGKTTSLYWIRAMDTSASQITDNSLFRLTISNTSKVHLTGPFWKESNGYGWMRIVFPCHDTTMSNRFPQKDMIWENVQGIKATTSLPYVTTSSRWRKWGNLLRVFITVDNPWIKGNPRARYLRGVTRSNLHN